MSSIVGALTGGGGSGMAFKPTAAAIQAPVTNAQADTANTNVQAGLSNQGDFLRAVQAQNGLGNQTNVFNQQQAVANGTGPNPAQAMLAQSTGQNVANQSAMMAGQRGANANVGMMARQAAQQGAATQQQSAGQAATLQANQSLNALNQMGSIATNQANQQANATNAYTNAASTAQQNILGAIGAQNNANVGMQSNMNSTAAGLAGNVASQQGNMLSGLTGAAGSGVSNLMGGSGAAEDGMDNLSDADWTDMLEAKGGMITAPKRYADGGDVANDSTPLANPNGPQSNAGRSFQQTQESSGAIPYSQDAAMPTAGAAKKSSGGSGMDMGAMAKLGEKGLGQAWKWLSSGEEGNSLGSTLEGLGDSAGADLAGIGEGASEAGEIYGGAIAGGAEAAAPYAADAVMVAAKGGKVPAMVSPGEKYLSPEKAAKVASGKADAMKSGQTIPGTPKVAGAKNSYANDTVPATLQEGGIIIPRSVTQGKNAEKNAMAFVKSHYSKQNMKKR